jgi:hypothetical protein
MEGTLTVDDLERVYFRAQEASGKWASINAKEATDHQFDTWIRTRIQVQGDNEDWPLEERAGVCTVLWQGDALHMLRKDVED